MKYCTKCGARLVEGAKFCTVCGSRVDGSAPAENVQAISQKENTFIAAPAAEAAQPRKKFRWGILAAVLALVLIVGAAGAFFFRSGMFESAPARFVRIHRQMIDPAVNFSAETVTKQLNDRRSEKVKEYTGIDTDIVFDELRDGYAMIREVSERTGVLVKYTSGKAALLEQFLAEGHDPKYIGQPLPIDIYMKRDWNSWINSLGEKRPQQLEYL